MKQSKARVTAYCRMLASCVARAAIASGLDRDHHDLRACIERNERDHRALGRRWVGSGAVSGRFSVNAATDYFVARTLAEAARHDARNRPICTLTGLREDYIRAALLFSNDAFRESLAEEIQRAFPTTDPHGWKAVLSVVESFDYVSLVSKEGTS